MTASRPSAAQRQRGTTRPRSAVAVAVLAVGVLAVAAGLTGCGSRGEPGSPAAGSPTVSVAPTEAPPGGPSGGSSGGTGSPTGATGATGLAGPTGPPSIDPICVRLTERLTVVSFNIKGARYAGASLPRIAEMLHDLEADVVLLQEVDRHRSVTGGVDQAGYLAEALGMHATFGANLRLRDGGEYGTAILSRFPITDTANTLLPNRPGLEQRGLLRAQIEPHGRPISLYSTHLQHRPESMRIVQARALGATLAADPHPTVLGGDFNASPSSPVMQIVRAQVDDPWTSVGAGPAPTWPGPNPRVRIDFVLHDRLTPVRAEVPAVVLSDHRPVRATYEYAYRVPKGCAAG